MEESDHLEPRKVEEGEEVLHETGETLESLTALVGRRAVEERDKWLLEYYEDSLAKPSTVKHFWGPSPWQWYWKTV